MTFGPNHYVPVLKVKRGEKTALRSLPAQLRSRMTPLLEIVERKPDKTPSVNAHLHTAFKGLPETARSFERVFLDARKIASDGASAAADLFARAAAARFRFTPVTGLSRTADVAAALAHGQDGLALRLTREEFEAGGLGSDIQRFLAKHELHPAGVDAIVDLGAVDDMVSAGVESLTRAFLADVPDHSMWRSLTVSACAFPASMAVVDRLSHATVERSEWLAWRDGLHANRASLTRLPTFSDCAIQHPRGVEGFDPRFMQVSASVRYTLDEEWLLIKGQSTGRVPAIQQFPSLATQLVYGQHRQHFAGSTHCGGCTSIKAAADGAPKLGSPEVWRRLGTVHHITRVLGGLADLPDS